MLVAGSIGIITKEKLCDAIQTCKIVNSKDIESLKNSLYKRVMHIGT